MINDLLVFYDNTLLYHSNSAFLFFFAVFAFFLFLLFRCLWFLAQLLPSVVTEVRQIYMVRPHKKIPLKQSIVLVKRFLRTIDNIEQKTLNRIEKILDAIAREVLIPEKERDR